ncbi:hypothetical protein KGF54_001392 [Candida jiufengensis]|uniref:uncharacterized protein n=1 Tax=Candida jiufengensis TaxID=497108 RepID=UPI00222427A7|nr:uncharacterized protein KGF54_001392 [Candida jiufengensis]KAI5955890.1 hypothetical protein KGF54_001392 [Candida jiufengensis]
MEWTETNQTILEKFMEEYIKNLSELSSFYLNLDYNKLASIINYNDIEIIKLRIDEIFDDHYLIQDDLNYSKLLKSKEEFNNSEILRIIQSIDLQPFKENSPLQQQQPQNSSDEVFESTIIEQLPRAEMPKLTKKQRRQSLDLMHSRPSLGIRKDTQLTTAPAISTTNVNVTASSKAILKIPSKKFIDSKDVQSIRQAAVPNMKQRRTSLVGAQLPNYIRKQLIGNRQIQKITPKSSVRRMNLQNDQLNMNNNTNANNIQQNHYSPSNSTITRKQQTRLQNLLSNSQSLYAHSNSNDVESTTNTSDLENRLRYDTDDDDKEYISPDSLAKFYGLQYEGDGGDYEEEDDEDEDEDDEEENEFVNLEENSNQLINGNDENDYLFKI